MKGNSGIIYKFAKIPSAPTRYSQSAGGQWGEKGVTSISKGFDSLSQLIVDIDTRIASSIIHVRDHPFGDWMSQAQRKLRFRAF